MVTTFNRGLLLMMTIERWIVICRPLSSLHKIQSKSRFFMSILALMTWSLVINLPRSWEYSIEPHCRATVAHNTNDATSNASQIFVRLKSHPEYGCNKLYVSGYKIVVALCLNLLLPILVMIILNGMAVYTLIKGRETLKVNHSILQWNFAPRDFMGPAQFFP